MISSQQHKLKTQRSRGLRSLQGLMLLIPLFATSCTNEALFNAIQQNHLQRCETIPIAQQDACKQQFQTSYEEYQREREALVEDGQSR